MPKESPIRKLRNEALQEWLTKQDARILWEVPVPRVGHLKCHEARGRVFMILHYSEFDGWEIYTAGKSIAIDATLADAETRLTG